MCARRSAFSLGVLLAALLTVVVALAQPRGRGARPKPKATVDAGPAPETLSDDAGAIAASMSPGAPPLSEGGTPPAPRVASDAYDGGLKASPLTPQPSELPGATPAVPATAIDYDKLLGEISALRARVAAVGDGLFHSRIGIALQTDGDHGKIGRLTVSLDDGAIYTAPPNFRADDLTPIYEHAVAPGRHAITVDVDRTDERDETFRTSQRSRFVVDVPKDFRLGVELRLTDESTMGADFPGDRSGRYELRVRMKAAARAATR